MGFGSALLAGVAAATPLILGGVAQYAIAVVLLVTSADLSRFFRLFKAR
jgi:hypothetical protein